MTQYIGVIGYPLKHSLSPYFQQAAFDYYQLDMRYEVWETEPQNLPSAMEQLKQPQNTGANVTVPYKEAVLHFMDDVDDMAKLVGAVNTIVHKDGKLAGFNTDAHGFLYALRKDAEFEIKDKSVVILGAGGAARAVSFALLQEGVNSLTIVNRTTTRSEALVDSLTRYIAGNRIAAEITALSWQDSMLREIVQCCHLIVNCTTLGMKYSPQEEQSPLSADFIPKGALVYDLVYNPLETPLLRLAKQAGAGILGGLPMLVYQGAAAFKIWTGREAPLDIMLTAAAQALSSSRR